MVSNRENTPLKYPSSESDHYIENEEHEGTTCNDPIIFSPELLNIMKQHGFAPEDLENSFSSDENESGNPT